MSKIDLQPFRRTAIRKSLVSWHRTTDTNCMPRLKQRNYSHEFLQVAWEGEREFRKCETMWDELQSVFLTVNKKPLCRQWRRVVIFSPEEELVVRIEWAAVWPTASVTVLREKNLPVWSRNTIPLLSSRSYSTLPTELSHRVPLTSSTSSFPLNSCIQRRQMRSLKSILFGHNTLVTKDWSRYVSLKEGKGCLK
jgi:hypothetical protein